MAEAPQPLGTPQPDAYVAAELVPDGCHTRGRKPYALLLVCGLVVAGLAAAATVAWLPRFFHPPVGRVLVYAVHADAPLGPDGMQALVQAVDRRVNGGGFRRQAEVAALDARRIEVRVYGKHPPSLARIERRIAALGTLEFRIVCTRRNQQHARVMELATGGQDLADQPARWLPVAGDFAEECANQPQFLTRTNSKGTTEVLVFLDRFDVTGQYLTGASADVDELGRPSVSFSLNRRGATLFEGLTSMHLPDPAGMEYHLAIIQDGVVLAAPVLRGTISDRGQITGSFTYEEVEDMAWVLNAGALPAPLQLVSRTDP